MKKSERMFEIKKKALSILRKNKLNDDIKKIPDIFGIDEDGNFYHMVLDYPGTRYKQIVNIKDEDEFVKYIVRETIYERDLGRL